MVAFDNMQSRAVRATNDWKEYSIRLPLQPEARLLFFGFGVSGTGIGWADDLQILVDGKPIWEAPAAQRPKTAIDQDHEFDAGSKIGACQRV
jgi:hypothetical protein